MLGVLVGSAALIIILSVFNGFEGLILSMYNNLGPDLEITPAHAKHFNPKNAGINELANDKRVLNYTEVLQEKVMARNVVGLLEGSDPMLKNSFLVVGGHYDHLGMMGPHALFPGANDNASGVAMLLYLSQHYANNPPEYSMVFIAFSAEEAGLLGSDYFLQNPPFETEKIKLNAYSSTPAANINDSISCNADLRSTI